MVRLVAIWSRENIYRSLVRLHWRGALIGESTINNIVRNRAVIYVDDSTVTS